MITGSRKQVAPLLNSWLVLVALAFFLIAGNSQAQDVTEETTSRLTQSAEMYLAKGDYRLAIPALEELVRRLKDTESPSLIQKLEKLYFFLGISLFQTNKLRRAAQTFSIYIKRFPKTARSIYALQYAGDCLLGLERYENALVPYEKLLTQYYPPYDVRIEVVPKIVECYIQLGQWEKTVPLLTEILREGRSTEIKVRAEQPFLRQSALRKLFP